MWRGRERGEKVGGRLIERGWDINFVWVSGHVGVRENEEVDELASEGSWNDEEVEETKNC